MVLNGTFAHTAAFATEPIEIALPEERRAAAACNNLLRTSSGWRGGRDDLSL